MKFKKGDYVLVEYPDEKEILEITLVEIDYGGTFSYKVISSTRRQRGDMSAFVLGSSRYERAKLLTLKDKLELL